MQCQIHGGQRTTWLCDHIYRGVADSRLGLLGEQGERQSVWTCPHCVPASPTRLPNVLRAVCECCAEELVRPVPEYDYRGDPLFVMLQVDGTPRPLHSN
jgi:hypothetical protein